MHHSMLLSLLDDISETMNLTKKRCQIIPSSLAECCKVSKNGSHELLVVTTLALRCAMHGKAKKRK